MSSRFEKFNYRLYQAFLSPQFQFLIRLTLITALLLICRQVFADDSADPLAGTDASLVKTLGSDGTARKFIYLIEGVVAIATYIKTKNILMFSGVVSIAIFLNILFKVAGVTG